MGLITEFTNKVVDYSHKYMFFIITAIWHVLITAMQQKSCCACVRTHNLKISRNRNLCCMRHTLILLHTVTLCVTFCPFTQSPQKHAYVVFHSVLFVLFYVIIFHINAWLQCQRLISKIQKVASRKVLCSFLRGGEGSLLLKTCVFIIDITGLSVVSFIPCYQLR